MGKPPQEIVRSGGHVIPVRTLTQACRPTGSPEHRRKRTDQQEASMSPSLRKEAARIHTPAAITRTNELISLFPLPWGGGRHNTHQLGGLKAFLHLTCLGLSLPLRKHELMLLQSFMTAFLSSTKAFSASPADSGSSWGLQHRAGSAPVTRMMITRPTMCSAPD